MSRKLEDLIPILAIRAQCLKDECKSFLKIEIMYFSTWRSFAEQEAEFAKGRTAPGPRCSHDGKLWEIGTCAKHPLGLVVTWARAGESYHNYGLAFDFCVDPPGPGVSWNPREDMNEDKIPDYQQVGEYAEDGYLEWGGRWPEKKKDLPHIQMSFGFSTTQLLEIYKSSGITGVWAECNKKYEAGLWP